MKIKTFLLDFKRIFVFFCLQRDDVATSSLQKPVDLISLYGVFFGVLELISLLI